MANPKMMLRFARWHIWLGWVIGLPVLMWTVTGLFMVARPIDQVRGNHLRVEAKEEALPAGSEIAVMVPQDKPVKAVLAAMEDGKVVTRLEYADGSLVRFAEDGTRLPPLNEQAARDLVKARIVGGVGQNNGQIEAVRTQWWRTFDFMWGLHILDPQTREDTSHPLLIIAAALSVIGALLGCILLFRRRKAKR